MKKKINAFSIINIVLIVLSVFITFLPFYLMVATSTKTQFEFTKDFWGIRIPPVWKNYSEAWAAIDRYILNTLIITVAVDVGTVFTSILGGYAFARMKFKGKEFLYFVMISTQMIPSSLLLVSKFINIYQLGLYNTHFAVILPAMVSIMFVMLSRSSIEGIPKEIFESVRIDGGSEFTIVKNIIMPLSKPLIISMLIVTTVGVINDYMWPLLVLSDDKLKTLAIGLAKLSGQFGTNYGVQMAAYTIVSIPLMLIITFNMKFFISGITMGAVKG